MKHFVTFMLICWQVREEDHPPLPQNAGERTGIVAAAKTYFVECFTHRFYLCYFLSNAMWGMAGCIGVFVIFLQLSLGLDMKQISWLYGFINVLTFLLYCPAGIISDRYHPLRLLLVSMTGITFMGLVGFIYLFHDFTPAAVLNITYVQVVISLVIGITYGTTNIPTAMKLLPKERYGQFSSADGMIGSLAVIFGGFLAGGFMDLMKMVHHGNPFYYRYIPVWTFAFQLTSLILMFRVYRGWQRLGGDKHYAPPGASANTRE